MATIKRRNSASNQCRQTRRVMTIVLLLLVILFSLRIGFTALKGQAITLRGISKQGNIEDIVVLSLQVDETLVDIRLQLYSQQSPKAAKYVKELALNPSETCQKCTLYRGEPVPSYWGSPDYPDRYFDHGRWGPPYALVQGGLLADDSNNSIEIPPAESHNPVITRGMVAWAGGKGGPHFFIALANHPEWHHDHTVFANVIDNESMARVDALLSRPLVSTKPKQPPIVSNFVTPIPFTLKLMNE